jgi:hypothetical protein
MTDEKAEVDETFVKNMVDFVAPQVAMLQGSDNRTAVVDIGAIRNVIKASYRRGVEVGQQDKTSLVEAMDNLQRAIATSAVKSHEHNWQIYPSSLSNIVVICSRCGKLGTLAVPTKHAQNIE